MILLFYFIFNFPARQKDKARSSLSELVMAVKDPRSFSFSDSVNIPLRRKSEGREFTAGRRNSGGGPPSRRNSGGGTRSSLQKISEIPDRVVKKSRKSGLLSFMGYVLEAEIFFLFI
jgi:phototropin